MAGAASGPDRGLGPPPACIGCGFHQGAALEDGGPMMWETFMAELRAVHLAKLAKLDLALFVINFVDCGFIR
jgi:hypothetical protein